MKSIKKTVSMPFSFFYREFEESTCSSFLNGLKNGVYSGKIDENRFILKYTSGNNTFKKNTYATIQIHKDSFDLEIFFISKLFNIKLYSVIFICSLVSSMMNYASYTDIITNTISPFLMISSIFLTLGVVAQVFPAYYQKKKTDDFILLIEKKYEIHCLTNK